MEGAHTQQSALKHDIVNKHSCFSFKHLLSLKKGKFAMEGDDLIEENEVHEGDDFIEKNQVYNIEEIKECENSSNDVLIEEKDRESSSTPYGSEVEEKKELGSEAFEKQVSVLPEVEIEMMKARFAKLLLGEDMSGCGNGVPTALAISNAITNLCATIFGQLWRLEPLPPEKKAMWRREMEWLLCVSDHIVELKPTWQTFPNGTKLEVMTRRPRSDLFVNLPALCDLDNMLLEILDSFVNTKFRYVDQGVLASNGDGSSPFHRQEEKWWLPVPQVPPCGLNESSRKHLQNKRDCANQISKAVMAINNTTLAEIEVPDTYLESLPKTARTSLGDVLYKYITSDTYSPESLLACLDISSEHQAIEIANRVEDSIYIWKKKTNSKLIDQTTKSSSRSWKMFKDLIAEGEKREMLIERAESILLSLKQHFPFLPQTTLDVSKIQCNKDIGKSILESYSRVLESLASNIVARIDDVLYVDDLTKHSGQFSSKVGAITHKSIPIPYRSSFGTTNCVKSPFINSNELPQGGVGMNKLSRDFSSIGRKEETFDEVLEFETERESNDRKEDFEIDLMDRAWLE